MTCYLSCIIGFSLIVATLAVSLFGRSFGYIQAYEATLDDSQRAFYRQVVEERALAFGVGTLLGLLLGLVYTRMSPVPNACAFLLIVVATQYFYYTLIPKKKWMLDVLKDKEEIDAWSNVYRYFKLLYHGAFVLSFIGFAIFYRGICPSS